MSEHKVTPQQLDREIKATRTQWMAQARAICGHRVRVLTNYNGQLFGSSRPSLKGRVFRVVDTLVDNGLLVLLEGHESSPYLPLSSVEFVDGEPDVSAKGLEKDR